MTPTRRDPLVEVIHGVPVADPYRWLEDGTSDEARAWVAAQDAATRSALDGLASRPDLRARFGELLGAGLVGACRVVGDAVFTLERPPGVVQFRLLRRSATVAGGHARVVIDPAAATPDGTAAIDWFEPSPDGRLVAYGLSEGGSEASTLHVVEAATGVHLADVVPDTKWASVAWAGDGRSFWYTRYPPDSHYGQRVLHHRLGDGWRADPVVWDRLPDESAMVGVGPGPGGLVLVHVAVGWSRADVHLLDPRDGRVTTVVEGADAVTELRPVGGSLVGRTTLGAPRGRVVSVDPAGPRPGSWRTLVPEGDDVIDEGGVVASVGHLLVRSTRSAVARLRTFAPDGEGGAEVALGGPAAIAALDADWRTPYAFVVAEAVTRPPALYRWAPGQALEPWSGYAAPVDPAAFVTEQHRYRSTDGAPVGLFVTRAATTRPSPSTPCVLTGYGGFAIPATPTWSPLAVAIAERGGLFADAAIRGGSEEGEEWHRAGMRGHKQQVFDDFHAAGDWLVAQGWTSPARLALRGGSNGGLLVGAALTQRPDLARAVHCAVPLLDMVRYHRFLVARLWVPEYGDPDVAEDFGWLYAYSPYHRVREGTCYPAVLLTAADEDGRVDPCHARKFAAALQHASRCPDSRPVLLRHEARAGHGVGKPLDKQADELADVLAFLWWQLGVEG